MLGDMGQHTDTSTPNTRYKSQNLGTWSSVNDVNDFLNTCCHDTGYYGATIGSYVTINDGNYNKEWIIAGFDMEHNQTAADNTVYDNGYGICLIPKTSLGKSTWSDGNDGLASNGYYGSTINKTTLPAVAANLRNILGNHLIERKVLLSNARSANAYPYAAISYIWTTAYCTLMSAGQVTGTFGINRNKYDDGEANYKLPLFNYETWSFDIRAWIRGIENGMNYSAIYYFDTSGNLSTANCDANVGLRPLIYIR